MPLQGNHETRKTESASAFSGRASAGVSCFPAALIATARDVDYEPALLNAAVEVNDMEPARMVDLLEHHLDPTGKRVAVLGLAFKSGMDDVRYSLTIPLIKALQECGAEVVAYDPVATENMQVHFPDIAYVSSAADALARADATLVVTDWDEFATLETEFDAMTKPIVIDGRRIIDPTAELIYEGLTW